MENFTSILWTCIGIIITGLVSWGTSALVAWLNTKIKNEKVQTLTSQAVQIVSDATLAVSQTFVDSMKKDHTFTPEAQQEAKEKAIAIVKSQMSEKLMTFIQENYGDLEEWIKTQIEAALKKNKNGN